MSSQLIDGWKLEWCYKSVLCFDERIITHYESLNTQCSKIYQKFFIQQILTYCHKKLS